MAALARAVATLLTRGGWLIGLVALEFVLLVAFWWSGPTPFGDAFDRRAAEADLLLLTLTSLPALFAGALLAAGDQEDGMADFFRSCRVSSVRQVGGTALGLFAVTGGALVMALPASLAVAAPGSLSALATWTSLGVALVSTLVHGAWGLALGSWVRSRWAAVAAALGFWVVTLFVLEALASAGIAALPPRFALSLTLIFTALDPAELIRVVTVGLRGQSWAFGPAFAAVQEAVSTWSGALALVGLGVLHVAFPLALAVQGWNRGTK